jgi:hypothetical protein
MRDQEDQMDVGSAGMMRGQSNVRIPQRRINRSLRSGVSPSMQVQPNAGNGQFAGSVPISPRVQPVRQMGPKRGRMFNQFMRRASGNQFQQARMEHFQGANGHNGQTDFNPSHMPHPQGNPIMQRLLQNAGQGRRFPIGREGGHPPIFAQGGHPPIAPLGPILGHGQTMNGMIQAIMGDLQGGINPDQFANMQAGNLPGGEGGDFLRALGGGDMNNSPLMALVQHLIQNPAGADGTPGNYTINGDQGGDIATILRRAIKQNPNFNPPPRPGRRGQQFMPTTPGGLMGGTGMSGIMPPGGYPMQPL